MSEPNSKKWIVALLFIFILVLVVLSAVLTKPVLTVFSDPVCAPPCWKNIQPGITTLQDAYQILTNLPEVDGDTVSIQNESWLIFSNIIHFEFKSREVTGRAYIVDNLVVAISFNGNLGINLSDAFAYLGEPSYVINIPTYGGPPLRGTVSSGIILVNPTVGYSVSYNTRDLNRRLQDQIQPEIDITLMNYFAPNFYDEWTDAGLFSFQKLDGEQTRANLIPWDGYGELAIKYPQVEIDRP